MRRFFVFALLAASFADQGSAAPLSPFGSGGAANALAYSWTGFYGGINAGYGRQESDWDFGAGGNTSSSDYSGVVGLQAGYGAQFGNNVYFGLEASVDASGIDGKSTCLGNETCETHLSSFGDVSARLGIVSAQSLLYLKGGVAYEDATHHIESPGFDRNDGGGAVYGYLVGGGAEYALTNYLTTKLEYDYMHFGSNSSTVSPGTEISTQEPINLVKLGFNLKFD